MTGWMPIPRSLGPTNQLLSQWISPESPMSGILANPTTEMRDLYCVAYRRSRTATIGRQAALLIDSPNLVTIEIPVTDIFTDDDLGGMWGRRVRKGCPLQLKIIQTMQSRLGKVRHLQLEVV